MSLQAKIKNEFAKIFEYADWELFKIGANYNLRMAAKLKNDDIDLTEEETIAVYCDDNRLLFRNIQKRMSIGIASELLVKAHYLKSGYLINKPLDSAAHKGTLHLNGSIANEEIDTTRTISFKEAIDSLEKLERLRRKDVTYELPKEVTEGLIIAQVYRNKEAHIITPEHKFVKGNYQVLEKCMKLIYSEWFGEAFEYKISFEKNEEFKFKITK